MAPLHYLKSHLPKKTLDFARVMTETAYSVENEEPNMKTVRTDEGRRWFPVHFNLCMLSPESCLFSVLLALFVCTSLQSCDGSEYTLQGPAGGDDITGLSAEPAHYQLLSELGKDTHPSIKMS